MQLCNYISSSKEVRPSECLKNSYSFHNLSRIITTSSLLLPRVFVCTLLSVSLLSLQPAHAATAPVTAKVGVTNTKIVKNGLVGHWTFDGKHMTNATATDVSGQGNHGTLTNMTTRSSALPGKIGQGLKFDGVDDFINLGTGTLGLSAGTSAFSVSTWVKLSSFGTEGTYPVIIGKSSSTAPYGGWQLNTNADSGSRKFDCAANISGSWSSLIINGSGSQNYDINKWYNVVCVYNGSTFTLYVNGTVDATASVPGTLQHQNVGASMYIGKNPAFPSVVRGTIDDVRVYNRALSALEVKSLYKAGGGVITSASTVVNKGNVGSGLVGHWTFDGKNMTNATATDISGNGNHGTLTNMTQTNSKTIGKIGQALKFDGTNDYMALPGSVRVTSLGSWSAWFKTSAGGNQNIIGKDYASCSINCNHRIALISGQVQFFDDTSDVVAYSITSPGAYNDGKWHHVIATWGSGAKMYVDGIFVGSSTSNTSDDTGSYISIGRNNNEGNSPTWYFNGSLDDMRIYNRTLSVQEVQSMYRAGGGATVKPPVAFICGTSNVSDVDGNSYNTVAIGSQCWMKQSLRTGTRVSAATTQTNNGIIEKHCYSNSDANCTSNNPNQPDGGLYQWNEAMQYVTTPGARGICPSGWHIPTHDELTTMERSICTSGSCATDFPYDTSTAGYRGTNEGTKLKPNGTSALEVNLAGYSDGGSFDNRDTLGIIWSSSESGSNAWYRSVVSIYTTVFRVADFKSNGLSVRCLKD